MQEITTPCGTRSRAPTAEALIAELAVWQHGPLRFDQLVALGARTQRVRRRVGTSRLPRRHRGVCTLGPSRCPAWVDGWPPCAGGDGTLLAHDDAAMLFGMCPGLADTGAGAAEASTVRPDG